MTGADLIKKARQAARFSQRQLADRSGVAQAAIARLEAGRTDPRVATVERLLRACDLTLDARPLSDRERAAGIDRTQIHELLRLTPAERLRSAATSANNLRRLLRSARFVGVRDRKAPGPG